MSVKLEPTVWWIGAIIHLLALPIRLGYIDTPILHKSAFNKHETLVPLRILNPQCNMILVQVDITNHPTGII